MKATLLLRDRSNLLSLQTKPPFPFVPGTECCGTVAEVGSQVTRFTKGMRVVGFNNPGGPAFGAWSEYALFPEFDKSGQSWIYESPPFLRDREAVAVMANYPTALYAFCNIGSTPLPDEKPAKYSKPVSQRIALVHGGAGGMGTASIHIAKHYLKFGTVIATCSTPEKAEIAKACGADHVVDYSKDDWVAKVREICRTKVEKGAAERDVGVDVVMETVGNSLEGSIKCARWGCRIVIIGFAGGEMPKVSKKRTLLLLPSSNHSNYPSFDLDPTKLAAGQGHRHLRLLARRCDQPSRMVRHQHPRPRRLLRPALLKPFFELVKS